MAVSALKTTQITALDAQPFGDLQSAGAGAKARINEVSGFVTTVAADSVGSTYRLLRVPSTAILKVLVFFSAAQGAGAVQLSAYYSDSAFDGTAVANQGLIVPTTGAAFFSDDINCAARVAPINYLINNDTTAGANNFGNINKRLWDALGLTSDPGGYFDIVAVVHTTAITTGAALLGARAEYAE